MRRFSWIPFVLMAAGVASAADSTSSPAPTPALTRPEMKKRLEGLKQREARLPLPPLTADELASGRRSVNNGRLRSLYLPASWVATRGSSTGGSGSGTGRDGAGRGTDVARTLAQMQTAPDFGFKTRLFWIVSRTNDCTYCLGHQELKLRRAGMAEDEIAALDSAWDKFPAEEQAAIAFTRKVTIAPHRITDEDLAAIKRHYKDEQILDILQTIAGNNSTNRWTASTGIPQDQSFGGDEPSQLDTPTSEAYATVKTKVAPIDHEARPAWEPMSEALAAMEGCRNRAARVTLPSREQAQAALASDTPGVVPPNWVRAAATTPATALRVWKHRQAIVRDGKLDPKLNALIAWVAARDDRAWYAAVHARTRLQALGVSDEVLAAAGMPEQGATFSPAEQAALALAHKVTSAPHTVVDADLAAVRKHFSDSETAEVLYLACEAASFDRITEVLRLPLEEGTSLVVAQ